MSAIFKEKVKEINPEALYFQGLETLQVNLGNMCNQECLHCHVKGDHASTQIMNKNVILKILHFLKTTNDLVLDITGGCPELHPDFKFLVEHSRDLTSKLMVRTNLTILLENGMEWIPEWFKEHRVILMASLPCYTEENVDRQRGNGAFEKSIKALKRLNASGYGDSMELNLVYNPGGDFLPGLQKELEQEYKKQLSQNYGIVFNNLFTITNAPLGRFRNTLQAKGLLEKYQQLLMESFNPDVVANIMCRRLINIDWQGTLYNCDFNQAAGTPIKTKTGDVLKIEKIEEVIQKKNEIVMSEHCFCCTAGAGSSCTGDLVSTHSI